MATVKVPPGSIRRFDLARDGEAVADLIEEAFALNQDPDGQFVLIQMRENARKLQQSGWMPVAGSTFGYVWEVDGHLVGNVSVIPAHIHTRWLHLIANVAVEPAYRGLGIGKALTAHALRESRKARVCEVWLQVKKDNEVAVWMYQQLGFRKDHCLDVWKKAAEHQTGQPPRHHNRSLYEIRKREYVDWWQQKEWLGINYPAAIRWYTSLDFNNLSPWAGLNPFRWLALLQIKQQSLYSGEELAAVLSWQKTASRSDNLYLAAPAGVFEGEHLGVLLKHFLQEDWDGKSLTVEYPAGRAAKGFEDCGFSLARTLLWMRAEP